MPVFRAQGSFSASAAAPGEQACTDPVHGAFRPKLIFFLPIYTGTANNYYHSFGAAAENAAGTAITQIAMAMRCGDNVTASHVRTARYDTLAFVIAISSGIAAAGTVGSISATGFTPNVSTTHATTTVHWIALGGDIAEAQCLVANFPQSSANTVVQIPTAFAPDVAIACAPAVMETINTSTLANASWSMGWATRAGGQSCVIARHVHNVSPTTTWQAQSTAHLYRGLLNGTIAYDLTVNAWQAGGLAVNVVGTPFFLTSNLVFFVFARGGTWKDLAATGANAATQAIAVTGQTPKAVLAQTWARAADALVVDGHVLYSLGMGIGSAAGQQAVAWGSDADAVATTSTDGDFRTNALVHIATVNDRLTIQANAAISSLASEAINLAWSPVDSVGRQLLMLSVGDAVTSGATLVVDTAAVVIDARPITLSGPGGSYALGVDTASVAITPQDVTLTAPAPSIVSTLVLLTPDEGEADIAAILRAGPALQLWLLTGVTGGVHEGTVLANLVQVSTSGTGYLPRTLDGDSATVTTGDPTTMAWPAQHFTLSTTAGTITHIALVNALNNRVRHVGTLEPAFVPNGTAALSVPVKVTIS